MLKWMVVFFSLMFTSATAYANCLVPDAIVLGSYPVDGGTNVPLNTKFIVYTPSLALSATLNGDPLTRETGNIWIASENLAPNTAYTLVFELDSDGQEQLFHEASFQSGTEVVDAPSAPVVHGYGEFDASLVPDEDCRNLAKRTGCADSEEPDFFTFDVEGEGDFYIANVDGHPEFHQLWPGHCGAPSWEGYGGSCFDVYTVENGLLSDPTQICGPTEPDGEDQDNLGGGDADDSGCQSVGGLPSILGCFFLIWGFRRRQTIVSHLTYL
jgi:hypothetical protein